MHKRLYYTVNIISTSVIYAKLRKTLVGSPFCAFSFVRVSVVYYKQEVRFHLYLLGQNVTRQS